MRNKYTDVMLDLETVGIVPGSALIQIAAVPFNINTGKISTNVFNMSINLQKQLDEGFTYNQSTLDWWEKENLNLFKELSNSKNFYVNVGIEFQKWYNNLENKNELRLWGNSNRFDIGILHGWYIKSIGDKFNPFWNTWNERDVRTIASIDPVIKNTFKFIGIRHNAIDDCKHQIRYMRKILRKYKLTIS